MTDQNNNRQRLCLSLFSGIGGGALGFTQAGFRTIGVDYMPEACRDYTTLTGHPCHEMDLRTATPRDLRAIVGEQAPDVVFTSPPCQAFSGCLPLESSRTRKYVELSTLSERGLMLVLEAWPDAPPKLIALENVPNIKSRGRVWLDAVAGMLGAYGYGWRETTHDCGELGGLAQHRRRFLGVARHHASCGELLFEPPRQRVRGVGEVLGGLPVPGPWAGGEGGPMHRLPRLSGMNWLRLACIEAGGDWSTLPERVRMVATDVDPTSRCTRRAGSLGVTGWSEATHAVIGAASVQNTALQVADPRVRCDPRAGVYGVRGWADTSGTVVGAANHDNGTYSVSDPRWPVVTHALSVARDGVLELIGPALDLDAQTNEVVIRALDGTWHRPLTTLELAVLQGFPARVGGEWLELDGRAHRGWRKRIGNAVPPPAARAIAGQMLTTLEASERGELLLAGTPAWVAPAFARAGV